MSGATSERPAPRPVCCVTLDDSEVVAGFSSLETLLRRCLGRGGGAAAVTSEAGLLTLTSCSERLAAALPPPGPPLALVLTALRHQTDAWRDGGLATGALLAGLLARLLRLPAPRQQVRLSLQRLAVVCRQAADTQRLRLQLQAPQLLAVAGAVLRSKPALALAAGERRHLALQVARALLLAVPAEVAADGRAALAEIHVQVVPAGDVAESRPLAALLLREPALDDGPPPPPPPPGTGPRRCLLLTPHLGGPEEALADTELALPAALARRPLSVERSIAALAALPLRPGDVVACQRTVHADVRRALAARGALVLERLGARGAVLFGRLTGAAPLGGLTLLAEAAQELRAAAPGALVGRLDAARATRLGGQCYVELSRADAPVVTLLVHFGRPEEQRDELKRQIEAGLFSLCSLLAEPSVVPGGGCLETVLVNHVRQHIRDQDRVTRDVGDALCSVLRQNALSIAGRPVLWSDAIYGHAWETEVQAGSEDDTCVCGLLRASDLRGRLSFSELTPSYFSDGEPEGEPAARPADIDPGDISEETLVDCARVKTAGLTTALEACHAILGIGTCVFEKR